MIDRLHPGEFPLVITETAGDLAFGQLYRSDGTVLIAPDGICTATAAIHRRNWGELEPRSGDRFAVRLSPVRQQSSFTYFANSVRMLSRGPALVESEERF